MAGRHSAGYPVPARNDQVLGRAFQATRDGIDQLNRGLRRLASIVFRMSRPAGEITIYAGQPASVPDGWLLCRGQSLLRADYPALFLVIGAVYGAADGTHFNLPNLMGRVIVGQSTVDSDFDTLGETGGSKALQLHDHSVAINVDAGTVSGNIYSAVGGSTNFFQKNGPYGKVGVNGGLTGDAGTGNSGNVQPYMAMPYIIKT